MEPPTTGCSGAEGHGRRSAGVSSAACARLMLHMSSDDRIRQVCTQSRAAVALTLRATNLCRDDANPAPLPVWCCPKCRYEYTAAALPSEYRCYCGKQVALPLIHLKHDEDVMTCSMASRCLLEHYP